ncbi:enoyl-CoA hydratase/isomerase family protein (plasmid) [Bradyrhizobium sp. 62B]|uniref:enoyl-CoA hydratase/isomerase family protein n=1 Tax=Bradyrhizobium sp. 62B TaxID=2898442 RepID=UPI002558258C|nr:enoyl-CoA hydratase/isomerase family protein [Bradyrhizobium sp. 62B]
MAILETDSSGGILIARFNHPNAHNPMSRELENAIRFVCHQTEENPTVRALVLTGGNGRSFCAGGDFSEVGNMSGRAAVEDFIGRTIDLYSAILKVTKPTVAAVGGYAVGLGFQLALCCDWRIGSPETKLLMWELKYGLACPVGGYMLENFVGRAAMLDIIYGCEAVPVSWATNHKLLNEVVDSSDLLRAAIARAQLLGAFPETTFRQTKASINQRFIAGLHKIAHEAKEAHVAGFASRAAEDHFKNVLGE